MVGPLQPKQTVVFRAQQSAKDVGIHFTAQSVTSQSDTLKLEPRTCSNSEKQAMESYIVFFHNTISREIQSQIVSYELITQVNTIILENGIQY